MALNKLSTMQQMKMAMPTMSDDSALVKKILAEHEPDQGMDYNVKPLLHLVEDIIQRSTFSSEGVSTEYDAKNSGLAKYDHDEYKTLPQSGYTNMLDLLSYKIDRISSELSYKALSGGDAHCMTVSTFEMVRNYKWDVKLVLTLAAFVLTYGEFWLLAHIHATNQLANSMAILKQVPGIMEHAGSLKPRFDALHNLVQVILDVTKSVIDFNDLPHAYVTPEVVAYSTASNYIPIASYWSIRGIVACATQVTSLTTLGYESVVSTSEAWELSTLAHKLTNILALLRKQLDSCYRHIERKMDDEAYETLVELFKTSHLDNMKILRALIYAKDDILPLLDGSTNKKVSLDVLRRKNVLLLISGLDFSQDELLILEQIYNESRGHASKLDARYEMVWLPIVERQNSEGNDNMQTQFKNLQSTMPWYSVCDPSLIGKAVNWFLRKEWKYKNKPILVVLDPQGKVVCPNAIHMMWIWGSSAFPFTSTREAALWREETWRLELLVDGIDSEILNWVKEGKYIILYGSGDVDWVRKFVNEARRVGVAASIPLEMVYVGKSTKREQVRRVLDTLVLEKLPTHYWLEQSMIWFFWIRLESMLFSKIQLHQVDDHDIVTQEIKKLLSYDQQDGWFILAKGSSVVVNGHAKTGLQTLIEYDNIWKGHADEVGYDPAFEQHYRKLHAVANPCCRFEFSQEMGRIPDKLRCPECQRQMRVFSTFQCYHYENLDDSTFVAAVAPSAI